ncbi:MAG: hypothetical protein HQL90_07865 [Magnetococcales bacterium]|nr:hypothetical protein [Magnetococcales bacterium]
MLDWTLQLLNHAWAPWVVAGLLLVWGAGHWVALQGNFFRPLHQQLLEMRRQLEETPEDPIAFAGRFLDIGEPLTRLHLLAPAWSLFSKSLVVSPVRGVPLYGSREPRHFFNVDGLMGREAAHYYYRTIPNMLLGIGVLVTLIGLVAAIHFTIQGMDSGDLYATQSALMGLLNAASIKFLTSIVGLAVAMLFSWEEKRQRHRLERDVEQICQLLQERMAWTADDQVGRDQLQATQAQSRHLQEIADRLHQVITQPSFQANAGKSSGEPLLTEGIAERLASQFDASMAQLRQTVLALGESIKKLPLSEPPSSPAAGVVQNEVLERLSAQLGAQVAALTAHAESQSVAQTALLERLAARMEQSVAAVVAKAATVGVGVADLEPLLNRMQQDGERLLQANEAAMGRILAAVGQQVAGLQTESSLALLRPDERSQLVESVVSRMERAMALVGDAGLSPFHRIAGQLERAITRLDDRVNPVGVADMASLVLALRAEGERMHAAHTEMMETLRSTWSAGPGGGASQLSAAGLQTEWLAQIAQQMEESITALVAKVGTGMGVPDLEPLLSRMQQDGERLLQANEAAMGRLVAVIGQQIGALQTDATLAALRPDERSQLVETAVARMEQAMAHVGDATLSPFHRIAGQLEHAVILLNDRLASAAAPAADVTPLVAALRAEGERMQAAHASAMAGLLSALSHRSQESGHPAAVDDLPGLMERMGFQIENAIASLGEKMEASFSHAGLERLAHTVRQEGAQLVRANEVAMQNLLELVSQRLADATATATLSELQPAEREGLLERVAARMERAVASLGEVGLAPFFDSIRREMEQIPGVGSSALNETLQGSFARITQQLDSVTAALESKVWAAETVPDMGQLVKAIRGEGERLLQANAQAVDRLFAELSQRSGMGGSAGEERQAAVLNRIADQMAALHQVLTERSAWTETSVVSSALLPDMESLVARIQREGERLVQANERAMAGLLSEVARRFAAVSATTALAELHPVERSELLDGVAVRMERAVASLGELGLTPFFDGMRHEIGQLIKANQQAVTELVHEINQRSREQGSQEAQLLESVVAQVGQTITRMGEKFAAAVPQTATLMSEEIGQLIRREGERLQGTHQQLLGQLERLLSQLAAGHSAAVSAAPVAVGEVVAVLDEQSMQPLLDGWRREGERLVLASEAAFERLLEELGQQFAQLRSGEGVALLEQVSSQLHRSVQAVREPAAELEAEGVDAEGMIAEGTAVTVGSHESLRPVLLEMNRIISQQRREERRLLKQVVNEVNRSVAALDAKIGRATPLNMKTLVSTVQDQGERLFATVNTLAPALAEMTQLIARQRGEEMQLLERVATEVNRSVAALDARIGRATPLQLKSLLDTVQGQGERLWAGSQEIVRELRSTRAVLQPGGRRVESGGAASAAADTRGAEAEEVVAPVAVVSTDLPAGMEGVHRLLEALSQPAAVGVSASVTVAERGSAALDQGVAPVESGLLLAYESAFRSDGVVRTDSSSWVAAKVEGSLPSVPKVKPAVASFVRLLPEMVGRTRAPLRLPSREEAKPLVVVAAEQGGRSGSEVGGPVGDLAVRPLVPTLLQEFGSKKNRSWQPFTVFVERQTSDSYDSQKRFSLFKG